MSVDLVNLELPEGFDAIAFRATQSSTAAKIAAADMSSS